MNQKRYNIRVYALIIHKNQILLTDEFRSGMSMTKFPGGGHEWGESLPETLVRECQEELGQTPIHYTHFYTTDFFVTSAFRDQDQLIAIYYLTELSAPEKIVTTQKEDVQINNNEEQQFFRWKSLESITDFDVTFPIDQKVVGLLKKNL